MSTFVMVAITYFVILFFSITRDKNIVLRAYSSIAPYKSVVDELHTITQRCPTNIHKLISKSSNLFNISQSSRNYIQEVSVGESDLGNCVIDSVFIDLNYSNRLIGKKISLVKTSANKWVCFSTEIDNRLLPKGCQNFMGLPN